MNLRPADLTLVAILNRAFSLGKGNELSPLPALNDWELVAQQARHHGLAPLLFEAVRKLGLTKELPPAVLLGLRRDYLKTAHNNQMYFQELATLLDRLAEAQIPVVLLKGSAHAVTLYDSLAQRPMCDLDFLVAEKAIPQVQHILKGLTYQPHASLGNNFEQDFQAELCYMRPLGENFRVMVEPHWHVFSSAYYMQSIPIEWFWQRTLPLEVQGRVAQMLSPTAALLHLAGHLYIHHRGEGLRQSHDIARLLVRYADQIKWDEVFQAARAFNLEPALKAALQDAHELWHVALPAGVISQMADGELHLDAIVTTTPNRYARHLLDMSQATSLANRLAYLFKLLFPGYDYLHWRYGMTNDRLAPLYYIYRLWLCFIGIPGMLLAVARRWKTARPNKAAPIIIEPPPSHL